MDNDKTIFIEISLDTSVHITLILCCGRNSSMATVLGNAPLFPLIIIIINNFGEQKDMPNAITRRVVMGVAWA